MATWIHDVFQQWIKYSGNIIFNELTSDALQDMLYDLHSNHTGHKEADNLLSQNFMTTFNDSSKIVLKFTSADQFLYITLHELFSSMVWNMVEK